MLHKVLEPSLVVVKMEWRGVCMDVIWLYCMERRAMTAEAPLARLPLIMAPAPPPVTCKAEVEA